MTDFAYFVTEDYIKQNSPLTGNVDPEDIFPYVKTAQDIYIKDKLGSALYDELMNAVTANAGSPSVPFTTDQITLLKMVRDALVWYSCYEGLPFIAIKMRNKGVIKTAGDFATNADLTETKYLRADLKEKGDYYIQRVIDYLCKYSSLYPNYTVGNQLVSPSHDSYVGIAFDVNDPSYVPIDAFKIIRRY